MREKRGARAYTAMILPVSGQCNLKCEYCYRANNKSYRLKLSLETYEKFAREYIRLTEHPFFIWQGGEPTLIGLDFYKKALEIQHSWNNEGKNIINAIQTNGTLIDKKWASFFKLNKVIVGVSLDGPEEIHNYYRYSINGKGSFKRAIAGIKILQEWGVEPNILTVVHNMNVSLAEEIFEFLLSTNTYFWQFIPCVDLDLQTRKLKTYSIQPEEYADFMCRIFDIWVNNDNPEIYIRTVDEILRSYLGIEPQYCVFREECNILTLDSNGDIYPCDFFTTEEWKLGNINNASLEEILASPVLRRFCEQIERKKQVKCRNCEWYFVCKGGCPRYYDFYQKGEDRNIFCSAFQKIFTHFFENFNKLKEDKHSRIGALIRYYEHNLSIKERKK